MNRLDEIQATARDIADWVCADPADRNRMADDLIKLVSLVVAEASSPGCDLERWTRPDPTGYVHPEGTGWTYTDRRPDELKRTAGTVTELRTVGGRTLRTVPDAPESCGAVDAADLDACGLCPDCRRSQLKVVADPESSARSVFGPVRKWGRLPEQPQQGASQPSQHCGFIPGDAVPACDFDPNCPTHGILGKQP